MNLGGQKPSVCSKGHARQRGAVCKDLSLWREGECRSGAGARGRVVCIWGKTGREWMEEPSRIDQMWRSHRIRGRGLDFRLGGVCMVEEIQGWGLAHRAVEGIGVPPGLCGPILVGCVSTQKLGDTCP